MPSARLPCKNEYIKLIKRHEQLKNLTSSQVKACVRNHKDFMAKKRKVIITDDNGIDSGKLCKQNSRLLGKNIPFIPPKILKFS